MSIKNAPLLRGFFFLTLYIYNIIGVKMIHVKRSIGCFFLLILFSGISFAQITLTLPNVSGLHSTSSIFPIRVNDLTGLSVSGYQFQLNYNPNIIKIYGASVVGTLSKNNSPQLFIDTVNGKFRVAWASSDNLTGGGTLINIKIAFKNNGTTDITYITSDDFFKSTFGTNKTVTPVNGSATTTSENAKPTLSPSPSGPYNILDGQNLNINLNGADANVSDVLTYSYVSTPTITGATLNSSTGIFNWTPTINQSGSYSVTFSVTDGKDITTFLTTITVTSTNIAPTLTLNPAGPSFTINDGDLLSISLVGADANPNDVASLVYTISDPTTLPAGAVLTGNVFTWTPTVAQRSTIPYSFTFMVKDQGLLSATKTISVTVAPNVAPTFSLNPSGPYVINEGSTISVNLVGSDANPGDVLTYSYTSNPEITGAVINASSGLFTWTPLTNQAGVYNVNFKVTDGIATTQIGTTITVNKVNLAPTLSLSPSATTYLVAEGQTLTITLLGSDPNTGDVLTYSYVSNPAITGATLNSSTGVFNWTPTINQSGSYSVTFSVTDGKESTTFLTTITVTSTNVAPTLTLNPTGPYALNEGSTLSVNLVGSDANQGDVLTYSYTSNPEMTGAVINASSGLFSWTTLTNQAGVYNVSFNVTDGKATTQISTTITVNKVNLAPTLSLSPSASAYLIAEGQTLTITLLGTDPNTGDVLTYSIPTPATLPTGANLTGNVFTWTPTYDQGSTAPNNFTFTVTDQSGLFASVSKIIIVNNTNQAPVFTTELPANVTAQVYDPPVPDSYTFQYVAVDPDNDNVVYILVSGPIGSSITADGLFSWSPLVSQAGKSYVVTVQASDGKLSTQSTQQVIKASDDIVGVEDVNSIPTKYYLYQNFPNPFNPSTSIEFAVPKESQIKLSIFNTLGQEIEVLVNQNYSPGIYKVNFNASKLNSGIYLYKIESNDFVSLKKMMLLK
jgi:hypothetical protein